MRLIRRSTGWECTMRRANDELKTARIVILTEDRRKRLLEIADELKELLAFLGDNPISLAVRDEDQQDLQTR